MVRPQRMWSRVLWGLALCSLGVSRAPTVGTGLARLGVTALVAVAFVALLNAIYLYPAMRWNLRARRDGAVRYIAAGVRTDELQAALARACPDCALLTPGRVIDALVFSLVVTPAGIDFIDGRDTSLAVRVPLAAVSSTGTGVVDVVRRRLNTVTLRLVSEDDEVPMVLGPPALAGLWCWGRRRTKQESERLGAIIRELRQTA